MAEHTIEIFGKKGVVTTDQTTPELIRRLEHKYPRMHWYGMRHNEHNLSEPETIEPFVVVNKFGSIGFEEAIRFEGLEHEGADFKILTEEEKHTILKALGEVD